MTGLRIDKLIWYLRLAKSRTLAQKLVAAGAIRVDRERVNDAARPIVVGQTLSIAANDCLRVIRVDSLPTRRGPFPEAQACYTELLPAQPIDAPENSA